jgi:hypothetical protein
MSIDSAEKENDPIALARINIIRNVIKIITERRKKQNYHPVNITVTTIKNLTNYCVHVCITLFGMVLKITPKTKNCGGEDDEFTYRISSSSFIIDFKNVDFKNMDKWVKSLTDTFNLVNMARDFDKLLNLAERLKLFRFSGEFYDPEDENSEDFLRMEIREWSAVAGITIGKKCCVCDHLTEIKTQCGHTLCYECWDLLAELNCPQCQSELKTHSQESQEDC